MLVVAAVVPDRAGRIARLEVMAADMVVMLIQLAVLPRIILVLGAVELEEAQQPVPAEQAVPASS